MHMHLLSLSLSFYFTPFPPFLTLDVNMFPFYTNLGGFQETCSLSQRTKGASYPLSSSYASKQEEMLPFFFGGGGGSGFRFWV